MSASTSIQWTDKTWNPVTGCTKVSPGCAHCYAEAIATRLWPMSYPKVRLDGSSLAGVPVSVAERYETDGLSRARQFTDVQAHEDRLLEPLSWRKKRERCFPCMSLDGEPCPACGGRGYHTRGLRVFVNSMSDLFHEDVTNDFIDTVFAVMALASRHTFQVLTKRPERMRAYVTDVVSSHSRFSKWAANASRAKIPQALGKAGDVPPTWPLPNVWLGVSVENQHFADERIPLLLQTPAAVRFISAEPLLGPVDIEAYMSRHVLGVNDASGGLDWVIVGGESGPGARPFDLTWARSIVAQCQAAGVACFVKQLGAKPFNSGAIHLPADVMFIRDRKGGDMTEWPADLRVRDFPKHAEGVS